MIIFMRPLVFRTTSAYLRRPPGYANPKFDVQELSHMGWVVTLGSHLEIPRFQGRLLDSINVVSDPAHLCHAMFDPEFFPERCRLPM